MEKAYQKNVLWDEVSYLSFANYFILYNNLVSI